MIKIPEHNAVLDDHGGARLMAICHKDGMNGRSRNLKKKRQKDNSGKLQSREETRHYKDTPFISFAVGDTNSDNGRKTYCMDTSHSNYDDDPDADA